jgi:hypothetical protein
MELLVLPVALPAMFEKVKDCDTTNGHVGPIARTLMKDAREDLIHLSGTDTPVDLPGTPRAGPTHFTSLLAAQSDLLSIHDSDRHGEGPIEQCGSAGQASLGSCWKASPYFKTAHAIRAFLAAIATAARQYPRRSTRLLIHRLSRSCLSRRFAIAARAPLTRSVRT